MTEHDDDPIDTDSGAPVAEGELLAGKYRVEKVLGAGGMGVVVAATHVELGERVAIKFLHEEALQHEEATARFMREARAAVRIKSEHVARVIDVGRLESGAPYMVMEYLSGRDLSATVKGGTAISVEDAVDYLIQTCDAMADAHALGIVHRDLKPANLFLTERSDGSQLVKVLDFGISKVTQLDVGDVGLTRTSTAMGSPLYMSPEQMRSAKNVDHRTDIWSLGAILFELLGGVTPFNANSFPELCAEVLANPPRSLKELRPDVPAELEAVIGRCLEKQPEARYGSVAELAAALLPFAPRHSRASVEKLTRVLERAGMPTISDRETAPTPSAEPAVRGAPAVGAVDARTMNTWADTRPGGSPKRTGLWLLGALGALLLIAGAGFALTRPAQELASSAEPAAEPTSPPAEVREPEPTTLAPSPPAAEDAAAPLVAPAPGAAEPGAARAAAKPKDARKPAAATTAEAVTTAKPEAEPKPAPTAPATTAAPAEPKPPKNPLDMGLK